MRRHLALPAAAAALALAPAAQAHVTVHPNVLPAGQFVQVVVRVPNERDDAATTKIDVRFPSGFIFVSTAQVPGWTAEIVRRKLRKPVTVLGEEHTEEVGDVIWSGGRIEAGQFVDLPLSVAIPDRPAGTMLTLKALQTYSNGEIVRWIGTPTADSPAPQLAVAGPDAPVQDVPSASAAAAVARGGATGAPAPTAEEEDEDSEESLALVLGTVGTVAGVVALAVGLAGWRRSGGLKDGTT